MDSQSLGPGPSAGRSRGEARPRAVGAPAPSGAPEHSRHRALGPPRLGDRRPRPPSLGKGGPGPCGPSLCPAQTALLALFTFSRWSHCDRTGPCSCALLHTTPHGCSHTDGCYTDGCFLGKASVCGPPHLCHSSARRAHDWPAGPRATDCLPSGSPVAERGRPGGCPLAHRVSGAAICPGCAFAPVPAGSALLSNAVPELP